MFSYDIIIVAQKNHVAVFLYFKQIAKERRCFPTPFFFLTLLTAVLWSVIIWLQIKQRRQNFLMNTVTLKGIVKSIPEKSAKGYYEFELGIKRYSGYEDKVVLTWDNGTNPKGEVGYYPIYDCTHCKKPYALIPTQVHYNGNHDIFYTGGKRFLNYDDEELLKSKVKNEMLKSIDQYTRRIKDGETSLDSWQLNYWLQGDIEHAIAEFLYEAGYKK